jgi:hypothetical protein
MLAPTPPPARIAVRPPTDAEIAAALERAARENRVPSGLLKALVWHENRWRPARADWRPAIDAGAKALALAFHRAPILGNGVLEDGRNILECWFFALGRYGVGKEGEAANAYACAVLATLATGGEGRFPAVRVTLPSPEALAWGRNAFGAPAPWHFGDVAPWPRAPIVVSLDVPYVHQAWDAPDDFDGSGSCGPCSLVMVQAFFQKLGPNPVRVSASYAHESALGGWVKPVGDAVCDPGLGAVHAKMLAYLKPTLPDAAIFYDAKATWARVKAELDAGRPVVLGTQVTPAGHLMVARGYLSDGRLIVNDPAGDQTRAARRGGPDAGFSPTGNRYWNGDGAGAIYDWDALAVRWVMTFGPRAADADRAEDEDLLTP